MNQQLGSLWTALNDHRTRFNGVTARLGSLVGGVAQERAANIGGEQSALQALKTLITNKVTEAINVYFDNIGYDGDTDFIDGLNAIFVDLDEYRAVSYIGYYELEEWAGGMEYYRLQMNSNEASGSEQSRLTFGDNFDAYQFLRENFSPDVATLSALNYWVQDSITDAIAAMEEEGFAGDSLRNKGIAAFGVQFQSIFEDIKSFLEFQLDELAGLQTALTMRGWTVEAGWIAGQRSVLNENLNLVNDTIADLLDTLGS